MNTKTVERVNLGSYTTFGIDAIARQVYFLDQLSDFDPFKAIETIPRILGGGSNVLCLRDVDELVLINRTKGIELLKEDAEHVWLQVASGENWHRFVLWTLEQGFSGIENLALIPGTVGAAPIQNIGAYGVEVKDSIEWVEFWNWETHQWERLNNEACCFGYRDSIFKQTLRGKYFISRLCFRLNKKAQLHTEYGAIKTELEVMGVSHPRPVDVANAVIRIRSSKLPDPKQVGNAGSFFKNPTIPFTQYEALSQQYPDMPAYVLPEDSVKVPAAWLIEQCGWKAYRKGDCGVHERQALVMVNYGKASGKEIWDLSEAVLQSVKTRFGIELEREVQVW